MAETHSATRDGRHPTSGVPPARHSVALAQGSLRRVVLPIPGSPTLPVRARRRRPPIVAVATWTLLVAAVLALAASLAGPRLGLYRLDVVLSGSMRPAWQAGDLVVTVPRRPQELRVGDVITYNPPIEGRPSITHRIVRLTEPGPAPVIVTRGDANPGTDPWGPVRLQADRVWVVSRSLPRLGWAIAALQARWVALVTTLLAPLLLVALLLRQIWRPHDGARG